MKKTAVWLLCAFLMMFAANTPLFSQSTEESAGRGAEQAGKLREALTHYLAALQSASEGSADDQRLREAIIKLVQKLSPPPALPEEARRFSVRGQTWIKEAKNPSDFDEAAKEFGSALRIAPWWADGYINQAVALEKAGRFSRAILSLRLYLLAAPAAPDAEKVKEQIYALEVRQEKAARDAVAERQKEEQQRLVRQREEEARTSIQGLAGTWVTSEPPLYRYAITVRGSSIEIVLNEQYNPVRNEWLHWRRWGYTEPAQTWRGEVEKLAIRGTHTQFLKPGGPPFTSSFTAKITPDGRRIHLSYVAIGLGGEDRWERDLVRP
jgi:tetratricopeptide (TPR) repeat protein